MGTGLRLSEPSLTSTVKISDLAVTNRPGSIVITHALGSCVAVALWDPRTKATGLLHYMLPAARNSSQPDHPPAMFADTGIPLLFESMYALGAKKADLVVKVAGGASMSPGSDVFDVGKRNLTAMRKILWKNGILIKAEDTGGSSSRTIWIETSTGRTIVRSPSGEKEL
ncbi:chemotaxis protein CheD [Myxococcota bacterium]|nr:chemotaxis protein CheD [Myxococcota bacterium]